MVVCDTRWVAPTSLPADQMLPAAIAAARRWIAADPDRSTAAELTALVDGAQAESGAAEQLIALFTGRVAFGTAGLRAALGPGPNRMNRLVVRQTTTGLMRWFAEHGNESPTVVIGFDARHGSADFANDTAAVVASMGGSARILPEPLPTPVLAHAVLAQNADAGVMVTASHNPPADNGYKLYLADGIQLVSPADAEIAAAIDAVAAEPLPAIDLDHPGITRLDESSAAAHIEAAVRALRGTQRTVTTVYSAMHGVGGQHLLRAFEAAGFPAPAIVAEQFEPDPEFPTVSFPNPEEPGALDLALALAARTRADLVIANDPDADRLALAIPARPGDPAGYVALTGDQIGVLLADHLLRHGDATGDGPRRLVSNSIVSSQLLGSMARAHGIEHVETLTGFKWVARPIVDRPDCRFVLGYEEALGYCVGDLVRDKDGISAALVAAEMAAEALAEGRTLWERLDRLAVEHGLHLTGPVSIRLEGADGLRQRTALLDELIAEPPAEMAGATLIDSLDLSIGRDLAPTPGFVMQFDDGTRVIVRPSGTEPKLKAYIEVIEAIPDDAASTAKTLSAARQAAKTRLERYQSVLRDRFTS